MQYGEFQIHALPEGRFTVGADKDFVPHAPGETFPKGTLFISVRPFLVITQSDVLLLDTGLGEWARGRGVEFLTEGLQRHGVGREEVTKVLLSHLHFDHAGGGVFSVDGGWRPTFPNAEYVVQKRELDAPYGEESDKARDIVADVVEKAGQLEFVEGSGYLTDEIEYVHTGGHTRDHQAYRLHTDGRIVVFGGDVLPASNQINLRFHAKYDFEPDRSQRERTRLTREAAEEGHLLLFFHSASSPAAYVEEGPKGGFLIEAVEL